MRSRTQRIVAVIGAFAAFGLLSSAVAATPVRAHAAGTTTITVLSNRADLISGGEALVAVALPAGTDPSSVDVDVDGRDVTGEFAVRPNGKYEGLVTGMAVGTNTLRARLADGSGANVTITNHPIGGPVFSGPQIQPWTCTAGAKDAQCDRPIAYSYTYKNAVTGQFDSYDPSNPPPSSLIASTTTDQGTTVAYIVRRETGDQDRDQYAVSVLFDPAKPWQPWAPQPGWNGKMVFQGGASCGFVHGEGTAPSTQVDSALSRGYAVVSTALDNNGHNCNLTVQAESVMMAEEHFVDHYGEVKYVIGNGCSGGSIFQQQDENEYPGLMNGLLPMCSFPDDWSTASDPTDCNLLLNYWNGDPSFTEAQQAAVAGDQTISVCQSWVNVYRYSQGGNPSNTNTAITPCGVTSAQEYDATSNPGGVRCTLQDYMVDVLGQRPLSVWTANEKKIGHGFANRPYDNVGVEYGLKALLDGTISPQQFADLNSKIGGFDIDYNATATRTEGDPQGLINAYRAGLVDETNGLTTDPIIDLRGHDTSEIHSDFRSYVTRKRLDAVAGGHGNQVIWTGTAPLVGDAAFQSQALDLMNQWLGAIEADTSTAPLAAKVVKAKPAAAVDACFSGNGSEIKDTSTCQALNPYYGDPRIAAGAPFTDDVLKCQLKPLSKADYPGVTFTDAQWAELQSAYPTGVCDFSRSGMYQTTSTTWLSFQGGPGGAPLGVPPQSVPFGVARSSVVAAATSHAAAAATSNAAATVTTLPNTGAESAAAAASLGTLLGFSALIAARRRRTRRTAG